MKLFFVADGPREQHALPRVTEKIIGTSIQSEFTTWLRLHHMDRKSLKGFGRKLAFSVAQALDTECLGVVAVVDQDRDRNDERLRDLRDTRKMIRERGNLIPIGLGRAIPHFEAWLLDDEKAVRTGLGLPTSTTIPNVRRVNSPKQALTELIGLGDDDEAVAEPLGRIAKQLEPARCPHAQETGFEGFVKDCRSEFQNSSPN